MTCVNGLRKNQLDYVKLLFKRTTSAQLIRPLPFSTPIVWLIGGIYTLRGMVFFLLLFGLYPDTEYFIQLFASSIIALVIGIFILRGMKSREEYQNGKNYQSS